MAAALALALTLASGAAPLMVAVDAQEPVLRGALALALVDDGVVVVPDAAGAAVVLRVLADGAGLQLASIGASERAATVAAGTPALVELEATQRALALVHATPPRTVDAPAAIFLDVDDRAPSSTGSGGRLAELLAAALLDALVPLAEPMRAAERLCVVATEGELTISWGTTSARCDGRQMGLARAGLSPSSAVGDALRLRDAAAPARPWRSGGALASLTEPGGAATSTPSGPPAAPPAAPPADALASVAPPTAAPPAEAPPTGAPPTAALPTAAPPTAAPPTAAPPPSTATGTAAAAVAAEVAAEAATPSLDVRVGALGRLLAVDPFLDAQLVWPLSRELGLGPAAWLALNGAAAPVPLLELWLAGGAGGAWQVAPDVTITAALVAGAAAHGWRYAGSDAGIAFDALVAAPVAISWRPGPLGASLALTPGALTRSRDHLIQGEPVWQRSAVFLGISAGLTWDIPATGGRVENSGASLRGEGDG